jgi:hypothetical protein
MLIMASKSSMFADGMQFIVNRNPEHAKRAADMQNFFECLAGQLHSVTHDTLENTVLYYNWNVGRFNHFGNTGRESPFRNSKIKLGETNSSTADAFKHFKFPKQQDYYQKHYGIDLSSIIPQHDENEKWDREAVLAHAKDMYEKVFGAFSETYETRLENQEEVPYVYDDTRGKSIYGEGYILGGSFKDGETTYSRIDPSYYRPTHYRLTAVDITLSKKIENIMNLWTPNLVPLQQPEEGQKVLSVDDEILNSSRGRYNTEIAKKALQPIIESLTNGSHVRDMQAASMQAIPQEQPRRKLSKLTGQQEFEISQRFAEYCSDLSLSGTFDSLSSQEKEEIKNLLFKQIKKMMLSGMSQDEAFAQMHETLKRLITQGETEWQRLRADGCKNQ